MDDMLSELRNRTAQPCENATSNIPPQFLNVFGFIDYKPDGSVPWTAIDNILLTDEFQSITDYLGIDCEMVGVGNFKISALGRVSIVNEFGYCVYDTFVNPLEEITDYNTQFSGIRVGDLEGAPPIDLVVEKVASIVNGRILVGHSIHNDLDVLKLNHPSVAIRDTANYFQHRNGSKRTPSLKNLIKNFFNATIQDGEHCSIQDAQATLGLYLLVSEEWEKDALERRKKANLADTVTDITCMHIEPRAADLFTESETIFIRPNKLDGAYYSSEEYKDIHFRLLMEDVLRPLRQDLRAFKQRRRQDNHFKSIRVAASNSLDEPDFEVKSSKTLLVPIRGNRLEEVDWDDRKIFLAGSLLILSPDNFHTIKCAKVIDIGIPREDSVILHLGVNFLLDGPSWKITDKDRFEMIESQAFFLPYEYTLNFLQDVDLDKFPMKKYIVDAVTKSDVSSHLMKQPDNQIDFTVLTKSIGSQGIVRAPSLEYHRWPSAAELDLDQSQYEGLQKALTQELTIIQGPPGTGKSHVSLQIVKMLLTNKWLSPSPILIVSYTNHALDELLEPILTFLTNEMHGGDLKKAEQSLLRIGGGCESEVVLPCTMKFKKEMCKEKRKNKKLIKSLEKALLKVHGLDFASKLVHQGIINFKLLPQIMLAQLETNETTKHIFKMWNKSHEHMCRNVLEWFGLSEQSVELRQASLISIRNGMFVLLCNNLETILNETFPRIPTTLEKLKGKSLHSANPDHQQFVTRWGFYFFLVDHLTDIVQATTDELTKANIRDKELVNYVKENQTIKNARVIGMTTTGAVKYKKMVETKFKSNIMIVEEAAHVLEAYVVASLTHHCTQLILIGDHKQLRPMIADHNLKESFLDVSLMERLVKNGIAQNTQNWTQLKVQHRMRTEIAELICPAIYDELENHSDVDQYPNVMGCAKNLFFVQHEHQESQEARSKSRFNAYEAKYIIGLLSYFTACGYLPTQISVICTYLAQKTLIENTINDDPAINQIQISTVDGYQGKQNDLIILSLVRNNSNDNVGFLDTDNRVCVALSRARHGLIMIGNMRILATCSDTWSKINKILVDRNNIGEYLPLTRPELFKLHDQLIHSTVKSSSSAVSKLPARTRRSRFTHQRNNEIQSNRVPGAGSTSSQMSAITKGATLACGHDVSKSSSTDTFRVICTTKVREQLPCGHIRHLPCNEQLKGSKCHAVTQKKMKCGHITTTACHKLSTATCMVEVKKTFSCGHRDSVPCQQMVCSKKIAQKLPCGHEWQVVCSEKTDQFKCTTIVKRKLPCGSEASVPCHTLPAKKASSELKLSCGHIVQLNAANSSKCNIKVREQLPCGHVRQIPCNERGKGPKCGALMKKTLKCGHTMDTACHKFSSATFCTFIRSRTFPCGHKVSGPCHTLSAKEARCKGKTQKKLSCGHLAQVSCELAKTKVKCDVKVDETLKCGHVRRVLCGEVGKKATKCGTLKQKKMKCGHTISVACHLFPNAPCSVEVKKEFPCGHERSVLCKDRNCDIRCNAGIKYKYPCGHTHVFPCGVEVAKKCNSNINRKLPCGHKQDTSCHQNPLTIKCRKLVTFEKEV
ncbi:NFX1-type zinc finger-containing protein 1-like isoform X2 [Bradysia coprophila]|uniref:NFX1-type zinc finger-containing protein 1-like isoform X2 n=1 Tax=Bradysia coprophila TaxID=38358 RepID=UPI00187DB11B|nr:NFX1-type zinc finger-containing protein 1-like isoform X2 [Bradysia coprophila]